MKRRRDLSFTISDEIVAHVRRALAEDVGPGDVTTELTVPPGLRVTGTVVARDAGVVAGLPLLPLVFRELDVEVNVILRRADGDAVPAGAEPATVSGPAAAILTGERTALNFLQHLSGIATRTADYVAAVAGTGCRILDTRKTLPGWRRLAKYAVRCGGGDNHRLGLYDRIMLKDNHWLAGDDDVTALVARAREQHPDLVVEVEVDDLAQFVRVLPLGVEWILLDNFSVADVAAAVDLRDERAPDTRLEVSGNLTLETLPAYARTGADAASVGRLTHSVTALDVGLDLEGRG
jgi:nicotinate-nucleotide pyrophosphorylase (carboxylating)